MTRAVIRDRDAMIAGMCPARDPDAYIFCALPASEVTPALMARALGIFREAEGVSLILPAKSAQAIPGADCSAPMARITLTVTSALDGVGLTAAVAGALAAQNIPCNVVAAFHHDHIFVPQDKAEAALAALIALQRQDADLAANAARTGAQPPEI